MTLIADYHQQATTKITATGDECPSRSSAADAVLFSCPLASERVSEKIKNRSVGSDAHANKLYSLSAFAVEQRPDQLFNRRCCHTFQSPFIGIVKMQVEAVLMRGGPLSQFDHLKKKFFHFTSF